MDGDIETRPMIHKDRPVERNLRLLAPVGRSYGRERIEEVAEDFTKLQANDPETILSTDVSMDREKGRLAVGMTVYGDHTTLHSKASEWLAVLRDENDEDPLGYSWAVGH